MNNAIISIRPCYIDKILTGEKTIEIRRRTMRLTSGVHLWLYATLPYASVVGVSTIKKVEQADPNTIWDKHSLSIAISVKEYKNYSNGSDIITAITLGRIQVVSSVLTLNAVREKVKNFHPPQFFSYIHDDSPLLDLFHSYCLNES